MVELITVTAPPRHALAPHRSALSTFISELNPLQYLPVIGTIYRAVTGDTIPETARTVGSLVMSGLTGGPVGVALSIGTLAAERAVGIDPEEIGTNLLASLGLGHDTPVAPPAPAATLAAVPAPKSLAWSATQLAAYGVTNARDGGLRRGTLAGADVLNDLELARVRATA